MRRVTKRRLANKLAYYPFLRLLLFSPRLRWGVALVFLAALVPVVLLPRIWRTSPPGFMPVIRIRALDALQAWSLKHNAHKAMADGRTDEAINAWQAAMLCNPASSTLVEGYLNDILKIEDKGRYRFGALQRAYWLVQLTGTNLLEAGLAAHVYEKYRHFDLIANLLGASEQRLPSEIEAIYLKALFNLGAVDRFAQKWEHLNPSLRTNQTLSLYHAAWQAGWGPPGSAHEGKQKLAAFHTDDNLRILANRLELLVAAHLNDADGYAQALQRLIGWHADAIEDHVNYWRLLALVGRKSEAAELARDYTSPPDTPDEAIQLASGYAELDLRDRAREVMKHYAPRFGYAPGVWLVYGDLLLADRQWDEVRALALQIRQDSGAKEQLAGYSYYLEGRAYLGFEQKSLAADAFNSTLEEDVPVNCVLRIADAFLQLGYPNDAHKLLAKHQAQLATDSKYWETVFRAASELKQAELMLNAAQRALGLQPLEWFPKHMLAVALIALREHPEQAVGYSIQFYSMMPNATLARLYHAAALLLNQRDAEAEALLNTINPSVLSEREIALYKLGWTEIYLSRHADDLARQTASQIDSGSLFPREIKWLTEAIPPKAVSQQK